MASTAFTLVPASPPSFGLGCSFYTLRQLNEHLAQMLLFYEDLLVNHEQQLAWLGDIVNLVYTYFICWETEVLVPVLARNYTSLSDMALQKETRILSRSSQLFEFKDKAIQFVHFHIICFLNNSSSFILDTHFVACFLANCTLFP